MLTKNGWPKDEDVPVVSHKFWVGFFNGLWISAILWAIIIEAVRRAL